MNCRLTGEFFSVVRLLQEEQKQPKDYGTGQKLFHSEINFMDAVYAYADVNVSELSQILGITKGAVTQIARKLKDKDLIEYYMLNDNKKEKYVRLTKTGEIARQGHQEFHREGNERLCNYFCSLNEAEKQVISDFLTMLQECPPFCEFSCLHSECGTQ